MSLPSFQFYPGDWLKSPHVRRLSHAAKGVWIDTLCLMFECDQRGVLVTADSPWSEDEWIAAVGGNAEVTRGCVREIISTGVASRRKDGAFYCRRMVRDEENRQNQRLRVVKHRCNASCNGDVTAMKHPSSSSSSPSGTKQERERRAREPTAERPGVKEVLDYAQVIGLAAWKAEDWFNEMEACGWLDYQHREVKQWRPLLTRVRAKWESDGRPSSPPAATPSRNGSHRPMTPYDLKTIIAAHQEEAASIKAKYCSDVAMGTTWNDEVQRKKYFEIHNKIKELKAKLRVMA
jgi:hypothetical protein